MSIQNRQCFFFTENHFKNGAKNMNNLPWKNTRNYMNKITVSEDDQFEICGLFPIHTGNMNRDCKEEKKNIPRRIITKLSAMSGTVDVFVSGMKLLYNKFFPSDEGMGSIRLQNLTKIFYSSCQIKRMCLFNSHRLYNAPFEFESNSPRHFRNPYKRYAFPNFERP